MNLRLLGMALATTAGVARRGWFIPHRYAESIPAAGDNPPYAPLLKIFDGNKLAFVALLDAIEALKPSLARIAAENGKPEAGVPDPRFDQGWFATLDAAAAYAVVHTRRPGRIIEVGSGHSTRFMARALHDSGNEAKILSIDPAPRAAIENLAPRVSFERRTVQRCDPALFRQIEGGDVLFIDSSHVLMPGSDCDFLFNRILPLLPVGALLHIHDIFLPDDYPKAWAWRNYNEQQGVAPMLLNGWRPIFASHYLRSRAPEALERRAIKSLPRHEAGIDASLWLEKWK
ncbi:MAG: class SAM-dependent methyltransferase [Alphaproteobacteria bacterium]|nr:class SAM-dependent methyltransferase [Alphaproteobacteria bacterium]